MSVQFLGGKYQRSDATTYSIYKKVESKFQAEGVRFMHVRDQLWLTAPDTATQRAATSFFKFLEEQESIRAEWAATHNEDDPRDGLFEMLEASRRKYAWGEDA